MWQGSKRDSLPRLPARQGISISEMSLVSLRNHARSERPQLIDPTLEVFHVIDIAGTAAFSIAGAFAAMEKKLDAFGVFMIAFVTALGGGTLRDVLIGETPVRWMQDPTPGLVVLVSTVGAMLFTGVIRNFNRTLLLFDSIGLGFFTVLGIKIGMAHGLHPSICVALGTMTACFGGVIRDISLNNIPLIFQRDLYATACVFGGIVFFLLNADGMPPTVQESVSIVAIVLLRLLAIRYDWHLPAFSGADARAPLS